MCVLWTCFSKLPSEEDIRDGFFLNSDGAGIAWFTPKKRVHWIKGLQTPEDLLKALEGKPLPLIIHCRMASAGGKDMRLTHPFPVNAAAKPLTLEGETASALAHNGHWGEWESELKRAVYLSTTGLKLPEGPWSDTRAMAWLAAHFGLGMLDTFPGKLALMHKGEIYLYGNYWHKDDWEKDGYCQSSSVTRHVGGSYDTSTRTWRSGSCSSDTKRDCFPTSDVVNARVRKLKGTQPIEIVPDAEMEQILQELGGESDFSIELT